VRFRFVLGLSAVLAIAIGSLLGAIAVRDQETDAFEHRQREEALRSARQAEAAAAVSVGQLATAAAFYQAVDRQTDHKFQLLADSMLHLGALTATGLLAKVPAAARDRFERVHGYRIVNRRKLRFRPAGRRPVYFPLTYAASNTGLTPPLGYDLSGDRVRSRYMLRAGASGTPVATRVIPLAVGGSGIDVFRPVYRDGVPTATAAQRRRALTGFAVGAIDVDQLAGAARAALEGNVDLQLIEGGRTVSGSQLSRDDVAAAPVRIADRSWVLVVHDPNRPGVGLPLLIAVFGISMAALLGALVVIWSRNERMQELQRQADQDSLTGLTSRRRFEEDLVRELARGRREQTEGALLVVDVDRFKQINDTLGHHAGDRVIAEVADVLRARRRATDVVARIGGDEFAAVLPRCGADEARRIAEGVSESIRGQMTRMAGLPPVTVSIGIAMFGRGAGDDVDDVQRRADAAMYEAKESGRDAIRMSPSEPLSEAQDASR
jgi:diguanylate cyclase (GGDEF)-like protein